MDNDSFRLNAYIMYGLSLSKELSMKSVLSIAILSLFAIPAYAFHPVAAVKHVAKGAVTCAKHPEKLAKSVAATSHDVGVMLVAQAAFNYEIAKKEVKFDKGLPLAAAKHIVELMAQ
jgi:hypothetical protein